MEYDKTNKGAMWKNEDSTIENKQPILTGKLNVEGKEYSIAAWKVNAEDGKKARFNLKISEPRPKEVNIKANDNTSVASGDIPF